MNKRKQFYLTLVLAFLLGNYRGYIALWKFPAEKPDIVFPYRVSSLPPADQEALYRGIHAITEKELHGILEDFLS